ncbi:MAG TPA: MlaD family protein, partial [Spirochaetota bacterium]|nr:MlaD family protein [Spirochaetota bacterium]
SIMIVTIVVLIMLFRSKFNFMQVSYKAYYQYGNDIKEGTLVTLNGINIGEVKSVEIDEQNRVKAILSVWRKYSHKIRKDSVAKIVRPLMIGNKQISISPGLDKFPVLHPGDVIRSEESSEMVDLVSGQSVQDFIDRIGLNPSFLDTTDDSFKKITVREIYDQAISSLVILNEFQKSIKSMSDTMSRLDRSMLLMSDSMIKLNDSMFVMANSMKEMNTLSDSMKNLGNGMGEMNKSMNGISTNMNNLGTEMKDMTKNFVTVSNSIDGMSNTMNLLNKEFSKNLGQFAPLSDKMMLFLSQLQLITEAVETNWLFKADIDRVKKKNKDSEKK